MSTPVFSFVEHPLCPWAEQLVIDGVLDENSLVNLGKGRSIRRVRVAAEAAVRCFRDMRCSELRAHFKGVWLPIANAYPIKGAFLNWFTSTQQPEPTVEFRLERNLRAWEHPWTPVEFIDTLAEVARESPDLQILIRDDLYLTLGEGAMAFPLRAEDEYVDNIVEKHLSIAVMLVDKTTARLRSRVPAHLTLSLSRFPERISFPIQQYLLYFFQFLSDMGIETESRIRHEGGRILFTYSLPSRNIALARMSEALCLYLRLPAMREFPGGYHAASNIAQYQLARTVTRVREALRPVEAHAGHGALYQHGLHVPSPAAKEDEESLIKDLVSVYPYTFPALGVTLDTPKLLRRLKLGLRRRRD